MSNHSSWVTENTLQLMRENCILIISEFVRCFLYLNNYRFHAFSPQNLYFSRQNIPILQGSSEGSAVLMGWSKIGLLLY